MLKQSKRRRTTFSYSWVFVIVAVLACSAVSCARISERFEDASAAEREGFFRGGWLPDVLPKDAGPIVEVHDLDTNARCSRSDFPTASSSEVEDSLRQQGFDTYTAPLPAPPFKNCPFDLEDAQGADVVLTRTSSLEREFAAIGRSPGVLLFWAD